MVTARGPARMRAVTAMAATATLVLAACGNSSPEVEIQGNRMSTSGTMLTLDGSPWWPVGLNAYQLGTDWRINVGCGAEVDLDHYFGSLPPNTLTRFNAYSSFVVDKNTGDLDFTPLDEVFKAAERHHQLLNAVLSSSEGACENGEFKNREWFAGRWRDAVPKGSAMSFGDWVDTAVSRWADSPAAVAWTAVGEPEPSNCGSKDCHWRQRDCPADAAQILRAFVDEVGARIRRLDPDAVLWGGRAGGGQCGAVGDEYAFVGASPGLDVLEYHDYEVGRELPGDPHNGLGRRIEQARELDKPLIVAELGVDAGSCLPPDRRHDLIAQTVTTLRRAGVAGVLMWAYVPDPRLDKCTYDIGPDDPVMDLIGREP